MPSGQFTGGFGPERRSSEFGSGAGRVTGGATGPGFDFGVSLVAMSFSGDLDAYRDYVAGSRGEYTVAKDQNAVLTSDGELGWNLKSRCQWFDEHSGVGRHGIWHGVEVSLRYGDEVSKRPIVLQDAEDGAVGTVAGPPGAAGLAGQAAAVDLPDHPPAREGPCLGDADKLVSDCHRGRNCPLGPVIPIKNVDIGAADGRTEHSDQNIEFANLWDWNFVQP